MANQGCRVCGGPLFRGQCQSRELHACRVCGGEVEGNVCLRAFLHEDFVRPTAAASVVARSLTKA